jgi:hypothetical protein
MRTREKGLHLPAEFNDEAAVSCGETVGERGSEDKQESSDLTTQRTRAGKRTNENGDEDDDVGRANQVCSLSSHRRQPGSGQRAASEPGWGGMCVLPVAV